MTEGGNEASRWYTINILDQTAILVDVEFRSLSYGDKIQKIKKILKESSQSHIISTMPFNTIFESDSSTI